MLSVACAECTKDIPEEAKFCPYCGAELPDTSGDQRAAAYYCSARAHFENGNIESAFNDVAASLMEPYVSDKTFRKTYRFLNEDLPDVPVDLWTLFLKVDWRGLDVPNNLRHWIKEKRRIIKNADGQVTKNTEMGRAN